MKISKHIEDFGRGLACWYELGDSDQECFFLAANGFPVASYQFMLAEFGEQYRITALENRGAWPGQALPKGRGGWRRHAEDLLRFLEYRRDTGKTTLPVTTIGHSIGAAVSLLAASMKPEWFKGVILIDPATLPGRHLHKLNRITPLLMGRSGLVKSTASRQPQWESSEAFARYHENKKVFRRFKPEAMRDYAAAAVLADEGGRLRYQREWEAWNFRHTPSLWQLLEKVSCPVHLLRAEYSNLLPARVFNHYKKDFAANVVHRDILGVGHMAPQEDPAQVASLVHRSLTQILSVA
ncbi:alpha/beta hydrolase [Spongiibacter sp. KMU-158]|uniref:Alpha/beta hydrolase n=1 Tax=Spongiibacter pelagi TaxID=2760804 RepID=A0A927GVF5_9GAMM|nr:alpha/beta hydrolase [Spongiibacter pelagi]MBD2858018.1 alpha/beta hydrolase [Spongiibacter pelagi]